MQETINHEVHHKMTRSSPKDHLHSAAAADVRSKHGLEWRKMNWKQNTVRGPKHRPSSLVADQNGLKNVNACSTRSNCSETIAEIKSAVEGNVFDIFRNLTHSPKGSAGNLAADDIHVAAMTLDKLVSKNAEMMSNKGLENCLEQLDAQFGDRQSLNRQIVELADNFYLDNIVNLARVNFRKIKISSGCLQLLRFTFYCYY